MHCRILVTLIFLQLSLASGRLVCPVNSQIILSTNRTLLPIESITYSSEHAGFNPASQFVGNEGDSWCSQSSITQPSSQYLELSFTEPVVLGMLISGGLISSYVSDFSISYSLSSDGVEDFQPYGALQTPQNFLVPDILRSDVHFFLEVPIIAARRIRFQVNDGILDQLGRICWRTVLFGCRHADALSLLEDDEMAATTTPTSPSTTSEDNVTPPDDDTSTPPPSCPPGEASALKDNVVLLIIVPVAVVSIIIMLIIVIVGVMVCLCCFKSKQSELPIYDSVKVSMVNDRTRNLVENGTTTPNSFHYDNPRPLYDVPRSRSRGDSTSTLGSHVEIRNPAYMTKKGLQEMKRDDGYNDYDVIPDTPTELEMRTLNNTHKNVQGKVITQVPLRNGGLKEGRAEVRISASNDDLNYAKVEKLKKKRSNGIDFERPQTTSPVLNSHYELSYNDASVNQVLAQEIDHLANELERSRSINRREWEV